MTVLDRIAAWLGYVRADAPRPFARIDNGADAVSRGHRWQQFYSETGGLADMIAGLRRGYFEKVGSLKPGDTDSLMALGMADRIAREIEREVLSVIETGKLRAAEHDHANRIASVRR